jgi:cell division protein FtsB
MNEPYYRKTPKKSKIVSSLTKLLQNKSILLALLIAIPVLSFMLFSNRGIIARLSLESDRKELQDKIQGSLDEQKRLQQQSKALDGDARAIEVIAREKYGMVRDGETIYKVRRVR